MIKKILKFILALILILIVAAGSGIGYLSFKEYKPAPEESVAVDGNAKDTLSQGSHVTIMTWNIGYGALGDNADFFMDGGENVMTADKGRVSENMAAITGYLKEIDPDILFVQEADRDSKRSWHIDEVDQLQKSLKDRQSSFAYNYNCPFVPFPWPPLGKVESGIATFSKYPVTSSTRVSLPCPFNWPIRTANLKRCLLVSRIPVGDKELVLVNLHLEAYDSGEGKIAQTEALKGILEEEYAKGNYVIAGGDFNQVFSNVDTSAYPVYEGRWQPGAIETKDFGDDWSLVMDARIPTCRSLDQPLAGADLTDFQFYVIDGFIVSNNVKIQSLVTEDLGFEASDHNPVLMTVELM